MQETAQADILLHVVDASNPERLEQAAQVNKVLKEIGADKVPQIQVWNKIDAAPELRDVKLIERNEYGNISRVFVSAREGLGLDALRTAIAEAVIAHAMAEPSPVVSAHLDGRPGNGAPGLPAFSDSSHTDESEGDSIWRSAENSAGDVDSQDDWRAQRDGE